MNLNLHHLIDIIKKNMSELLFSNSISVNIFNFDYEIIRLWKKLK